MIGYLLSRKRIRELEAQLKNSEKEIDQLHDRLADTLSPGEIKSADYCRICAYHIQLRSGFFFCSKCDTAPCAHFKLNEELYPLQTQQEQTLK